MANNLLRRRPGFSRWLPLAVIAAITAAVIAAAVMHAAPGAPAGGGTVTYSVTGSDARVTYGPAGSSLSGSAPMSVTQPLGNAAYYSVSAQLRGSGSVACEIDVNGAPVSQAAATAAYGLALCEITRDPLHPGQWRDANAG